GSAASISATVTTASSGTASGIWTGGAGDFGDASMASTTYTPAESEIGTTVTLTYTSEDLNGCGTMMATTNVTVNDAVASVEAGDAQTICSSDVANLSGTVTLVSTETNMNGSWSNIDGAGTLMDMGDGTATYTPAMGEAGDVTLRFTADDPDGAGPCPGGQTDDVVITVTPTPVATAPADVIACNGDMISTIPLVADVNGTVFSIQSNADIGFGTDPIDDLTEIAGFTAVNDGNTPIVATVTVTPTFTDNGISCTGDPVTFSITVNPTPVLTPIEDIVACNGDVVPAIPLTSSVAGSTIGYLISGDVGAPINGVDISELPSFTAINTGVTPIEVTVTVVVVANGCPGTAEQFTITVNPTPDVDQVADIIVCNGEMPAEINFTGAVAGTTFDWESDVDFGAGLGGTNTLSFTGVNGGTDDLVATVTVTPIANDCPGTPIQFSVTVRPTPTVDEVADIEVCSGDMVGPITFSGAVAGTTFSWVNSNTGIGGLAAMGTGDISQFMTAENTSGSPIVATVQVTPSITGGLTDCMGTPIEFTITVLPEPVVTVTPSAMMVCSDEPFDVTFMETSGLAGSTTFDWEITSVLPAGVTASSEMGSGDISGADFNNVSGSTATVEYTLTPTGENNCVGNPVTFTIMVKPEPVIIAVPSATTLCSGDMLDVDFQETSGLAVAPTVSWMITSTLPTGVSASAMSGTDDIVDLVFDNLSGTPAEVEITISSSSADDCDGDDITLDLIINPEPVADAAAFSGCAEFTPNIMLQSLIDNGVASSFEWYTSAVTEVNGNVFVTGFTGTELVPNTTSIIDDALINFSSQPQMVTYTVTPLSADGCLGDPFEVTVTVTGEVDASILPIDGTTVCDGSSITLVGNGTGGDGPYEFAWSVISTTGTAAGSFDDPAIQTVEFSGTGVGIVVVQLLVTDQNDCTSEAAIQSYNVNAAPTGESISGPTVVCPGSQATYSVVDNPGVTYSWSIAGNSGTILGPNSGPSINVGWTSFEGGPFEITLVQTSSGCSATSTYEVFTQDVAADFSFALDPMDGSSLTYDFTDLSLQATSWSWDFGGIGSSTEQNPSFSFPGSGTYTVCLTVDGPCGMDMLCQDVTVDFSSQEVCDEVMLSPGQNYISIDVIPTDNSIVSIFADFLPNDIAYIQGRDNNGNVVTFSPLFIGFPGLNTLEFFTPGEGYIVFLNGNVDRTLQVCGNSIDPGFRRALNAGISLVAYIPQDPMPAADFFADLYPGNLKGVRIFEDGSFKGFDPALAGFPGLNDLETVRNGKGYEVTLTMPVGEGDWFADPNQPQLRSAVTGYTNRYMVLAAQSNLPNSTAGGFVQIVTADGLEVGRMPILEGGLLMTTNIYGWDATGEVAGVEDNSKLYLQYGRLRGDLEIDFVADGSVHFEQVQFLDRNATPLPIIINAEELVYDLEIAPNPFRDQLQLMLNIPKTARLDMVISDLNGREVMRVLDDELQTAGRHLYNLEVADLPAGTYLLQVVAEGELLFSERLVRIQ
ncbi:MAG: PKD-like domain-containing protein, partial [Bacteroidota bacterium]